jgi:hypothetical protein
MRRHFRLLFVCFVSFVVSTARLRGAEAEFIHVWPAWHDADAFDRISEYFGGKENDRRETVLRTQADVRAGYYFLVRVKSAARITAAKFELSVIRPDSPEPKTHTFAATLPAKEAVYQLGLTGAEWPDGKKAHPVAWKLALVAADGRVLAEKKSFLWDKPAK